jgi:hypothetical protein
MAVGERWHSAAFWRIAIGWWGHYVMDGMELDFEPQLSKESFPTQFSITLKLYFLYEPCRAPLN